jgi:antibiotic biosynthesis monooxygenase (ABM) superfamily enzyme
LSYQVVSEGVKYRAQDLATGELARGRFHSAEQAQAWIDDQARRLLIARLSNHADTAVLRSDYSGHYEGVIRRLTERYLTET